MVRLKSAVLWRFQHCAYRCERLDQLLEGAHNLSSNNSCRAFAHLASMALVNTPYEGTEPTIRNSRSVYCALTAIVKGEWPYPLRVAVLCVLLMGCAITQDRSPIPYTLAGSEIAAVENGVRSVRRDLDNSAFRGFRATQHEDGQIDVCGWILPTGNLSEQPFIGTLFAGTFAPERIGGNEVDNAQIISDCQNR